MTSGAEEFPPSHGKKKMRVLGKAWMQGLCFVVE